MIKKRDAIAKAIDMGATQVEIDNLAAIYAREVKSVQFRNMIKALNMHPWNNNVHHWTRLAAALTARGLARKR